MAGGTDPKAPLPAWFILARSIISFVVGTLLVLHESAGTSPPGPIVIVVGLTLMGIAPVDLVGFLTTRGK